MRIVETVADVRTQVKAWRDAGETVGLVPTMGYLHEGHMSLVQAAKKDNDRVVVSIFVNPMQFSQGEDLETYPRDLEHDAAMCEAEGADLIFHPTAEEMYPEGFCSYVDMTGLTDTLCGAKRPNLFRGVCTVVSKLFHIVQPDRSYFGEKDAQQLMVIRRMVRDLNIPVEVIGCPIVREEDGLAKSSRNTYLSPEERHAAVILSRSIATGKAYVAQGGTSAGALIDVITKTLNTEPMAVIDYVSVVDLDTMQPIDTLDRPFLAAIAVYIGKTRLIDNFMVTDL